ncbi:MAG: beta-glucosidase [Bacteroidetes bacterium]|nr:beta-glucosidase [Bacteroidota bacterium]
MAEFPSDFIWGTATSAYQIEGGYREGGKGISIWDAFSRIPGKIMNGDTGEVACDHFHRFEEDVQLMKDMGVNAYRFSLAWTRIIPDGTGDVSEEGIAFYSKLIDLLLENNITPWVTLYHWDLPVALEFEKGGWLGDDISDAFAHYADVCFSHFGDRVTNWITLNEPWVVAMLGYGQGVFPPGIVSNEAPYIAGHNLLLGHAKAVDVYRNKYQDKQKGQIGIANNCDWREPLTDSPDDLAAAERALEFFLAWFADPIYKGDYPASMRERVGERLPEFTAGEQAMLKDSSDFFGLNHYTTMYAADATNKNSEDSVYGNGGISEDQDVQLSVDPSWSKTTMNWAVVPWGFQKLLEWIDTRYDHPPIIVTENGCAFDDKPENGEVHDAERLDFYKGYLAGCRTAISNGANVKGYFAWSFMDNFEWVFGYSRRFGMHYVDFETLERIPKSSAKWYARVIAKNSLDVQG